MSQSNIVLYMEEEFSLDKLKNILSKFNAKDQNSCWGIERCNSWIWVNYYIVEENTETMGIWREISQESVEKTKNIEVKTALFIQPSKDRNAVFFALSFCQEVYSALDKGKSVFLYHGDSGLFVNNEIENLKFKSSQQFYDYRKINKEIVENIIKCLNEEFLGGIECIVDDGGWDGEEIQYVDLFKNLFKMRDDLKEQSIKISSDLKGKLNIIDDLILKLFDIDNDKLLISAGIENKNSPIYSWWWHLDEVEAGILKVNIEDGIINYKGINIDMEK
ncbi:hypothetical protein J7E73_08585 [Paenibacillus albidus]|uniref:hypothetical protein n=1 Tax=Paenibacillus albidus TaxID=2041023 RepID=UPI001BE904A5|nr:hypothetical protein [Paenibacillus albidus]MBT2289188.1 hypothetical protein [Paenibacillus albidus]